ncbi:MAG TPA: hypothetical protein VGE11_14935 [Pseudonocardia sp.]
MPASVEVDPGSRLTLWPPPSPLAPPLVGRLVRGLMFAIPAADIVVVGRMSGLLEGTAGVLVAIVLILLVPTSRDVNRRILLAGCLLLGWTQVFWWWPLPVGSLGRVTIGLALLAGGLGAWVGVAEQPEQRARRLLPKLRAADAVVPATAVMGLAVLQPWLQAKTSTQTLGMLMGGWDNVAHFSMVHMIRRFGVTVDALPPPASGGTWQFASYPQGFHAAAAAVVELLIGPGDVDLGSELLAYTRTLALLVIAATVVLVAGFCALPALRRRPGFAAPVAAFVAAVILLGPGAQAVEGGIGNFAVACCLVVAVVLLTVPAERVVMPLTLGAIGGAVVGIATSWALLLVLALPALLVILLPLRRRRWRATAAQAATSIVLVLIVVGCLLRTAVVLSRVQAADPLTINGGRVPVDVGLLVITTLAIAAACVLLLKGALRKGAPRGGSRMRVGAVMAVPACGIVAAGVLIAIQVEANGQVTYYGLKFMLGMEIVLLPLLVVPLLYLLDRYLPRRVPRRRATVAGVTSSLLMAVALTQVFGLSVSDYAGIGLGAEALGITNDVKQMQVLAQPPSAADLVDRLTRTDVQIPPAGAFYIGFPSDGKVSTVLISQWFLAFTDTWTLDANSVASGTAVRDLPRAAAVAERILDTRPGAVVVVPREEVRSLRVQIGQPSLYSRIVGL